VAEPEGTDRRRDLPPGIIVAVLVLVLAPIVALLWVGSYAKAGPELWGFPFFYWYQLMWVPIVAILAAVAYLLSRLAHRGQAVNGQSPDDTRGES
jgi:membrane protein implicated in regulation of membrane protease activity